MLTEGFSVNTCFTCDDRFQGEVPCQVGTFSLILASQSLGLSTVEFHGTIARQTCISPKIHSAICNAQKCTTYLDQFEWKQEHKVFENKLYSIRN